jgi:hypothetical protein
MEEFSYAYVRALAAQAGIEYDPAPKGMDNVGIDAALVDPSRAFDKPPVRFSAQIKCARKSKLKHKKTGVFYELKKKYYDQLTRSIPWNAILLIVVVVPDEPGSWVVRGDSNIIVSHDCYWFCLGGKPYSSHQHEDSKESIKLDEVNLLTPESFPDLMQKIANGDI